LSSNTTTSTAEGADTVQIRKVIDREIRHESDGVSVKGGVNGVIAVNAGEPGGDGANVHASSHQRIVQRSGRKSNDQDDKEKP
jgi:hypothetical protein